MPRSPMEILTEVDLSFLQLGLQTPGELIKTLEDWGLDRVTRTFQIYHPQFEALHRSGVLAPMFRETPPAGDGSRPRHPVGATDYFRLLALEGQLEDAEVYGPWAPYQSEDEIIATRGIYYSPYQLLAVPWIERHAELFTSVGTGHSAMFDVGRWEFDHAAASAVGVPSLNRELIGLLNAIDSYYRPLLTRRRRGFRDASEYWQYRRGFNPSALGDWLGVTPDQAQGWADWLRREARSMDPLGAWFRVVKLAPLRWEELRGLARIAMETRIAADMLSAFCHDLGAPPSAEAPTTEWDRRYYQSLEIGLTDLQATLTEFGLSSRPAAVIVLEGESEYILAPRIVAALGLAHPERIGFHRVKGVDDDPRALEMLVFPQLSQVIPGGDMVLSAVPATRLYLAMDPEHRFETPAQRRALKTIWVDEMKAWAERQGFRLSAHELQNLVRVSAWKGGSFEFAHFTDSELAHGIRTVARYPARVPTDLERFLHERRKVGRGVSRAEWGKWGISKPNLADAIWVFMKEKIKADLTAGRRSRVPIVRVFQEAYDWAGTRSTTGLWGFSLKGSQARRRRRRK